MASWILVPSLVSLRNEFNELAPDRDKASDGSIGDTSHAASSSDHNPDETGNTPYEDSDAKNEVHAIDVDDDLRKSGWTMSRALEIIITRHREGRDNRLQNVIYNRRIWSASWGWTDRAYTGSNAHTEHAHFSARYTTTQEDDTRPWGLLLEEGEDDMTKAEFTSWMTEWATSEPGKKAIGAALMSATTGNKAFATRTFGQFVNDLWAVRDFQTGDPTGTKVAAIRPTSPLGQSVGVPNLITSFKTVFETFVKSEVASDAQEAARDAALGAALTKLQQLVEKAGGVGAITDEQIREMEQYIAEKVAEVGDDAISAVQHRLSAVAEALDNAGTALQTANDDTPPQA
jgi:hypothetical protein